MPVRPAASSLALDAVDDEAVGKVPLAADRNSLSRHRRGLREKLIGRRIGGRNARHKQRDVEVVAAVQRQVLDFGLRNRAGDLRARRFEHDGLAGDRDVRRGGRDGQRNRQFKRRADRQRQRHA